MKYSAWEVIGISLDQWRLVAVVNATAKETGITESILPRWESMCFVTADRVFLGDNVMRMYSDQLVDLLRRVNKLIDSGMPVRAAFEFLDGCE